jgi:outer membrane protein, heavy metal efflux system
MPSDAKRRTLIVLLGLGVAGAAPPEAPRSSPDAAKAQKSATAPDRGGFFARWRRPKAAAPAGVPARREGRPPTSPSPPGPNPAPATRDEPVRRTQGLSPDPGIPIGSSVGPPMPEAGLPSAPTPMVGGESLSLQAALYGALTSNPDLVTLRQGNPILNAPSPEAVEVARRFPTTLNPTLWIDYRPMTLIPRDPIGLPRTGGRSGGSDDFYRSGQQFLYLSYRQPIELGHQTTHRFNIAKAALDQQRWTVMQAELTALVQTYRLFQTAAYRRERLGVAGELADFNERLRETLEGRLEANLVGAADVVLARVEARAARQQVKAARQDYLVALTDLRNQVGIPEAAGAAEPLGEFELPGYIPPVDEQTMIREALESRPDIRAARAQVALAESAVRLARADRIPSPVVGPEYQANENGTQFVGFVLISPLPILNSGMPLVRQREAEAMRACIALQQAQQRAVAQVRAGVAKWNGATELVNETGDLAGELGPEVIKLERLFDEGQADLLKLMQARQRLIQLETSRLDAVWQATQAQADLLLALGVPSLIHPMMAQAETDARIPAAAPAPSPPPAPSPSPFRPMDVPPASGPAEGAGRPEQAP